MSKLIYKNGETGVILRFKILNSSSDSGSGLTGLTSASSGLIVSTIADNEASATVYTSASSNIETIASLGTYQAPTSGKCRFREVDSTNHPGLYELQLSNSRFSVASAKNLIISVHGATNAVPVDMEIQLSQFDLNNSSPSVTVDTNNDKSSYDLSTAAAQEIVDLLMGKTLDGSVTLENILVGVIALLLGDRDTSGTSKIYRRQDGSTAAITYIPSSDGSTETPPGFNLS